MSLKRVRPKDFAGLKTMRDLSEAFIFFANNMCARPSACKGEPE
jgi:hypothetical protein